MNDAIAAIALGRRIDLTREADFIIGGARIRPTACEVEVSGRRIRLQPRVMQVLVALARAGGEPVSREALIEVCWGSVTVGEDALNRCIQRLRRLAEAEVRGAFAIETIPRIGYRLAPAPSPAGEGGVTVLRAGHRAGFRAGAAQTADRGRPSLGRLPLRSLGIAAAMVALAFGVWLATPWIAGHWASTSPTSIRVDRPRTPAGDGPAAVFADGLAGDLAIMLTGRGATLSVWDSANGSAETPADRAALAVDGRVRSIGGRLQAAIELRAMSDGSTIWSTEFAGPAQEAAAMRRQAAVKIADVLACAVHDENGRPARLDVEGLRLYLLACDIRHDFSRLAATRELMRKIVARAPDYSWGWSDLAVTDALFAFFLPPDQAAAARREAASAADRALAINDRNPDAYLARSALAPGVGNWPRRTAALAAALAIQPASADANDFLAGAFGDVGRLGEATALYGRAVALDPLSPVKTGDQAVAQATEGDLNAAAATLDQLARLWPGDPALRDDRFHIAALFGDPADAGRLLDDPASRPPMNATEASYWRLLLAARRSPDAGSVAACADFILAHVGKDLARPLAIQGLAMVGRTDQAFDVAERDLPSLDYYTSIFFFPGMADFRRSPRFMPLARRLGLVALWQRTGHWPDFCTRRDAPYDCRAQAAVAGR